MNHPSAKQAGPLPLVGLAETGFELRELLPIGREWLTTHNRCHEYPFVYRTLYRRQPNR